MKERIDKNNIGSNEIMKIMQLCKKTQIYIRKKNAYLSLKK